MSYSKYVPETLAETMKDLPAALVRHLTAATAATAAIISVHRDAVLCTGKDSLQLCAMY